MNLGRARVIQELRQRLEQVGRLRTPVLFTGEPGSRFELCARHLHIPNTPWVAPEETDWARMVALYDELARLTPSPIVELNRAVAVARASGPAAGLAIVDALRSAKALEGYHLLPTVRGDLLFKLGRFDEARVEIERAAALTLNARERTLLLERAAQCAQPRPKSD